MTLMAEYTVPKRYKELVHLLGRAFYSGQCPPPEPDQLPGGRKKVHKVHARAESHKLWLSRCW